MPIHGSVLGSCSVRVSGGGLTRTLFLGYEAPLDISGEPRDVVDGGWEECQYAVCQVVVAELEMEYSTEKESIEARDECITCGQGGLPTKSSNSPLGAFAFLRFWRGRRLSEQPAGPYVNRRGRARSIFLLCLAFLFHNNNNKRLLSLQNTSRQPDAANRGISDVAAEDRRNSRRSPLPSFALLSTPGSLRQRKAAPPTATAPAPNNSRPNHHLHQTILSTTNHHQRPAFSALFQGEPTLLLHQHSAYTSAEPQLSHASTAFHRFTPYGGAWSSVSPTQ